MNPISCYYSIYGIEKLGYTEYISDVLSFRMIQVRSSSFAGLESALFIYIIIGKDIQMLVSVRLGHRHD